MNINLYLLSIGTFLCLFLNSIYAQTNEAKVDDYPYEGQRYDAFDWNLLKALGTQEFGNVVISPFSLKMVLAMVYEGSSGATEKEFEQVVNFPTNKKDTKKKFQQILNSLNRASSDHTLDMGSRVYLDSTVEAQQRFRAALKTFYDTDVEYVNFYNSSATKEIINYWISNVTHGHIKDLVEEDDLKTATLLIANALYYKGLWRRPFLRNETRPGLFYTAPRQSVEVQYMYINDYLYYSESIELDAKILRLPYKGGNFAMFVILPNSKAGLNRLISDLNPEVLRRHIHLMDEHFVNVYLPKFSFDFNAKLGRILQTLGLNHIFQNTASLAGIARGNGLVKKLMVSNIVQKAGIEVNEEGSTAYAATDVTLGTKFGSEEHIFNASRPFLFYIEDELTGSVLFAGKVENPVQGEQIPYKTELNFPSRFGGEEKEVISTEAPGKSSGIR